MKYLTSAQKSKALQADSEGFPFLELGPALASILILQSMIEHMNSHLKLVVGEWRFFFMLATGP